MLLRLKVDGVTLVDKLGNVAERQVDDTVVDSKTKKTPEQKIELVFTAR